MSEVPEALRLADCLKGNATTSWTREEVATELCRLHARVQELESIEHQLCEQADVAANAYRELQSEAAENARILGASGETELALRARVADLERKLAAIGAVGVEPLRKRAEAAPQAVAGMDDRDAAFEAVRKAFCKLQRYSFFLDSRGNVRRCADHCGNWVEFEAVHTLFEPQSVDAAIAAQI